MDKYNTREIDPIYWFNKATDLKATSAVIWLAMEQEYSSKIEDELGFGKGFNLKIACWQTYFMICGLSFELLFKAILLAKNIKIPVTHNLCKLAELGNVNYGQKEKEILKILSEYVIWSGKYPIPKKREVFEDFHNIHKEYFWKGERVGDIEMLKQKASFTWKAFNDTWKIGRDFYWNTLANTEYRLKK